MSGKIGVLFVHSSDEFGADAAVHADLMRFIDRDRFEVHVACVAPPADGGAATPMSILRAIPRLQVRPTHFVPKLGRRFGQLLEQAPSLAAVPTDLWSLRRYVRTNKIRIIHASDRPRNAAYCVLLGKLTGAKSVVHMHVKWSIDYGRAASWSVAEADAIFSISRYVTGTVIDLGRPASQVHTVLNAIDASRWDPETDGAQLRAELGVPPDATVLASVSRLFSWKGQRELLRAFAQVHAEEPRTHLLIVGKDASGPDQPYLQELRELATALGVSEHVTFTGPRADVPRVMAACDIFTLPSFEEPFGLVFLEAMAMRKPVVAIANGGTPEVVEHEGTGLLSPPWDVPALAANIAALVRDPELRRRLGENGRRRVLERFDAPRMAADAERAYLEVLAS
jgi:glycosyltransferase involved in cell wall biosynthesis